MLTNNIFKDARILRCLEVEHKITDAFFEQIAPKLSRYKMFFQREHRTPLDRIGVDAVMAYKGEISYVDIKNHAVFDCRKFHSNYAFELETGHPPLRTIRFDGWFLNEDKVTDVYMFLFWDGTPDNIKDMRVCVLRRQAVLDRLAELGIDIYDWKQYINASPKLHNGNHYWFLAEGIRIVQSRSLPEAPYSLVIPWRILSDIAIIDDVYEISQDTIQTAA